MHRSSDGCDFSEFVRRFNPKRLEITCDNIHEVKTGKLLGFGLSRKVHEGDFHGKKVAMKAPKSKLISMEDVKAIVQEVATLYHFRSRKSNIVPILGWCNKTIVLEKLDGTLDGYLKSNNFTVERALEISRDLVKGVQQMHRTPLGPVAHGDIKSLQYLHNSEGKFMLGDFDWMGYTGLSNNKTKCTCVNPFGMSYDEKHDILQVGKLLGSVSRRVHDEANEYPQGMVSLFKEAMNDDPMQRPSARKMLNRIEGILRDFKPSHA